MDKTIHSITPNRKSPYLPNDILRTRICKLKFLKSEGRSAREIRRCRDKERTIIQGNYEKMAYLIALKLLHLAHYNKGVVNMLLHAELLANYYTSNMGTRKTKVHQTILTNKLPKLPRTNTVRE